MNRDNISLPQLLRQIELYFDCSLTDAEESELRNLLALTAHKHPSIDEARAVMGFRRRVSPSAGRKADARKLWLPVTGVAAAVAVVVSLATVFPYSPGLHAVDSTCIAYINGEVVTDEEAVMRQLTSDMREFGDCAVDVHKDFYDELEEAFPVIDDYESENLLIEN